MLKYIHIIGLTGTLGAGKGTVANYIQEKGYTYTSCSDYLRKELRKLGIEENVDNLKALGDSLREKYGPGHIAEELLKTITGPTIVDSLRHPGEILALKNNSKSFILIAVDAPIEVRYERVKARKRAGDMVSFDVFVRQEKDQMEGKGGQIQLVECFKLADYQLVNDQDVPYLYHKVDQILKLVTH